MPKETKLNESAEIYNRHRDDKSEKEKWKDMTPKERYNYFKTYYLSKIVVIILVVAFLGSMIYSMVKPKPETLVYAAIIDYAMTDEMLETLETEFADYIGMDPETQNLNFDNTFALSNSSDYSVQQKFMTYLFAGELDIMIGGETMMKSQMTQGNLAPLSEQLPTELYSALKDYFVYAAVPETDADDNVISQGEKKVYGLYLDDCKIYGDLTLRERPVIGIVVNSNHKENAVEFIRYLFEK